MNNKCLLVFCVIFTIGGCGTSELLPATRLSSANTNETGRQLLEQAMIEMLNINGIIIADDAFVNTTEIIIERRRLTDDQGRGIPTRSLEMPVHFKLWKQGDQCLLEYVETGELREITGLDCIEIPRA